MGTYVCARARRGGRGEGPYGPYQLWKKIDALVRGLYPPSPRGIGGRGGRYAVHYAVHPINYKKKLKPPTPLVESRPDY